MTSGDERDWLETYEKLDDQLIRTALLEDMASILAEDGYTVDDLEAFAPGFCESVEQVGIVSALTSAMTEPDPDNPGKLIPADGNRAILALGAVRLYCPWYVAEFDRAIET